MPLTIPSSPIIDLHCDLLLYLARTPGATIYDTEDIGVTLPYLQAGGVKHQVMALFMLTQAGSTYWGEKQLTAYQYLLDFEAFHPVIASEDAQHAMQKEGTGITAAIENASVFAEEDEPIATAFARLDRIREICKRVFYITITHHLENRFGGGNYTNIGLKPDGERLLDYLNDTQIAVDLSHTSDALAEGILTYIEQQNLNIPIIASHSNFRSLRDHPRNLTREFVEEIIDRKGLIGANFLRLFLDGERPESLLEHIEHGLNICPDAMTFGADFFYRKGIADPDRQPLFFPEYEDAGQYPKILTQLTDRGATTEQLAKLAYQNTLDFMGRNWKEI
ncbi:MAG: membrane dipeptidase [Bacteroidota bacterium]